MKTTLMQLISLLEKDINSGMISHDEQFGYHVAVDMANELLEIEKKQIIFAVTYGNQFELYDGTEAELGLTYYNETYNQNK